MVGCPTQPGTYALVLACHATGAISIGRLGVLNLRSAFYVYIGSAFGPGGLASRIQHHHRIAARPHWHIDYLRAVCALVEVWFTTDVVHREHAWAKAVGGMPGALVPLPGFGSSDCECQSHLFFFKGMPPRNTFAGVSVGKQQLSIDK